MPESADNRARTGASQAAKVGYPMKRTKVFREAVESATAIPTPPPPHIRPSAIKDEEDTSPNGLSVSRVGCGT